MRRHTPGPHQSARHWRKRSERRVLGLHRCPRLRGTELAYHAAPSAHGGKINTTIMSVGPQDDRELHQLQPRSGQVPPEEGMAGHRQQRVHLRGPAPVLGRRVEDGRLLADHDGHVRHLEVLVEPGPDGPQPEDLGRRERGDLPAHVALRRTHRGGT